MLKEKIKDWYLDLDFALDGNGSCFLCLPVDWDSFKSIYIQLTHFLGFFLLCIHFFVLFCFLKRFLMMMIYISRHVCRIVISKPWYTYIYIHWWYVRSYDFFLFKYIFKFDSMKADLFFTPVDVHFFMFFWFFFSFFGKINKKYITWRLREEECKVYKRVSVYIYQERE